MPCESSRGRIRPLSDHELFRRIPLSYRLFRVYTTDPAAHAALATALDALLRTEGIDDATNM